MPYRYAPARVAKGFVVHIVQRRDQVVSADDFGAVKHDPFRIPPAQGAHEADSPILGNQRDQMLEPGC